MKLLHEYTQIHVIPDVVVRWALWGGKQGHEGKVLLHPGADNISWPSLPLPPCEDSMCPHHRSGSLVRNHRASSIDFPDSRL